MTTKSERREARERKHKRRLLRRREAIKQAREEKAAKRESEIAAFLATGHGKICLHRTPLQRARKLSSRVLWLDDAIRRAKLAGPLLSHAESMRSAACKLLAKAYLLECKVADDVGKMAERIVERDRLVAEIEFIRHTGVEFGEYQELMGEK